MSDFRNFVSVCAVATCMACGGMAESEDTLDEGAAELDAKTIIVKVAPGGEMRFDPAEVEIKKNDTVKWIWESDFHSVTSGTPGAVDGKFCSGTTRPNAERCASAQLSKRGATFKKRFTKVGTFPYHCMPHGPMGMTAKVTVK